MWTLYNVEITKPPYINKHCYTSHIIVNFTCTAIAYMAASSSISILSSYSVLVQAEKKKNWHPIVSTWLLSTCYHLWSPYLIFCNFCLFYWRIIHFTTRSTAHLYSITNIITQPNHVSCKSVFLQHILIAMKQ